MNPTVYTIGYELGGQAAFIAALQAAGIETLIDVRELPSSRRAGFSKTPLSRALAEVGIGYLHLKPLGTPKEGRIANRRKRWDEFWQIVDVQLATDPARLALEHAAKIARTSKSALLCLEADPHICHRSRVAALLADKYGFEVEHLHVDIESLLS